MTNKIWNLYEEENSLDDVRTFYLRDRVTSFLHDLPHLVLESVRVKLEYRDNAMNVVDYDFSGMNVNLFRRGDNPMAFKGLIEECNMFALLGVVKYGISRFKALPEEGAKHFETGNAGFQRNLKPLFNDLEGLSRTMLRDFRDELMSGMELWDHQDPRLKDSYISAVRRQFYNPL